MRLLRSIVVGVMFILTSFLLCPLSAQTTGAEGVVENDGVCQYQHIGHQQHQYGKRFLHTESDFKVKR